MKNKGFTLIEILVTLSIIGFLATIVIFSSASTLRRGRDAQRKSDLKNIADALELFYNDHGVYPPSLFGELISACPYDPSVPVNSNNCTWGTGVMSDDNGGVFMTQVPKDPTNESRYIYQVSPARDRYKVFAYLENPEDPNFDPTIEESLGIDCATTGTGYPCNIGVTSPNTPILYSW